MKVRIYFEPRDVWVGVYWNLWEDLRVGNGIRTWLDVYVCLVPMLPIRLTFGPVVLTDG